jgi:hypothetical protein
MVQTTAWHMNTIFEIQAVLSSCVPGFCKPAGAHAHLYFVVWLVSVHPCFMNDHIKLDEMNGLYKIHTEDENFV